MPEALMTPRVKPSYVRLSRPLAAVVEMQQLVYRCQRCGRGYKTVTHKRECQEAPPVPKVYDTRRKLLPKRETI